MCPFIISKKCGLRLTNTDFHIANFINITNELAASPILYKSLKKAKKKKIISLPELDYRHH